MVSQSSRFYQYIEDMSRPIEFIRLEATKPAPAPAYTLFMDKPGAAGGAGAGAHITVPAGSAHKGTVPVGSLEKKKPGRPSKADKLKERKAAASAAVAALIESNPSKKDVLEYLRARAAELSDEAA